MSSTCYVASTRTLIKKLKIKIEAKVFAEKTERGREFTIAFLGESDNALHTGIAFENSNSLLGGGDDGEWLGSGSSRER